MVGPVCVQSEVADVALGKAAMLEANMERLTVVLDMDECLLHSKFHGLGSAAMAYRQMEDRPEDVEEVNTFWVAMEDGAAQVNMRPGLLPFLEAISETCDVVVFTAAMPDYAGPVLDRLDPTGKLISKRLYRSSCRQVRGAFLKDLSALGPVFERCPGRCVLLDNNPCSFLCQPTNGILVTSFYDDAEDTALASVLDLVRQLERVPDVRPVLRDMFKLQSLLMEYKAILFPEGLVEEGADAVYAPTTDDDATVMAYDAQEGGAWDEPASVVHCDDDAALVDAYACTAASDEMPAPAWGTDDVAAGVMEI